MNLTPHSPAGGCGQKALRSVLDRAASAFTMIEIALCIAVVAIAMVAIMGVMPVGLTVQTQNREDTVIDQEAQILMDTIRGGSMRFYELTNYVDYIMVAHHATVDKDNPSPRQRTNTFRGRHFQWPSGSVWAAGEDRVLNWSEDVVGLLSLPQLDVYQDRFGTNIVVAQFRALTGPLNEKARTRKDFVDDAHFDFAFRYQVAVEIVQSPAGPEAQAPFVGRNFSQRPSYEARLTFRWPVYFANGEYRVGAGQKTYRTEITGQFRDYRMTGDKDGILRTFIPRRRFDATSVSVALPQ